jgi:NTP pyrophosphatase (non-canonical NTP hydrolase)
MTDLGWFYDKINDANPNRRLGTLWRRMAKLAEEYGELWEAYLNVTSANNGKNKTWEDVREESIDVVIVAIDIAATRLPIDQGKSDEEVRKEIAKILLLKLAKWEKTNTAMTDAVSVEGD